MLILAIGAAVGTFIENDFGSVIAKELVYNSFWYEFVLLLASLNMIFVIFKTKMYKIKTRLLLHLSLIVILLGALTTNFFGIDGLMTIKESTVSNTFVASNKNLELPFSVKLNDFRLKRYPGSKAPSEYSSDITVIDTKQNVSFEDTISMNNTLTYQGYKFFQTSYTTDEKSSIFTINYDPGLEITYTGYALLFLTLVLNLFSKKSRFQFLIKKIKDMPIASMLLPLFLLTQTSVFSSEAYTNEYLNEHRQNSKELAKAFGELVVQGPTGRMKPLDTQNREILNKLTGKETWQGMDSNQVILGMFSRPELWRSVNILRVKTPALRAILGVDKDQKLVKFTDFFDEKGNYKLTKEVEEANKLVPSRRGTLHRDIIKVDERLNIFFMTYRGVLLTIFPIPNNKNDKWVDFKSMFSTVDDSKLKRDASRLLDAAYNRNYDKGFKYIETIKDFQYKVGGSIIPSKEKLQTEIWFNKTGLFLKLCLAYLLIGFLLLIYVLVSMFYNKIISQKVKSTIGVISIVLLGVHTFGIAVRWYIGGYAPISNTYETMIYISYAAILASSIFLRKSTIALSASYLIAGTFIFAAYLGEIDPKITTLVPVLKSYWLSVHVSIITASYGFFGVGAVLGVIALIVYIFRSEDKKHLDVHIQNITYINEVTLILATTLLIIGNFLGGIWANESWGRYWSWDPKETWTYVSILVYSIVIHIRLLKKYYSPYLFNVLSVISFASILMTYFGVNFYLAGMHSYATGDPVPIPQWVYIVTGMVLLLIVVSYSKRNLKDKNEKN
jgi:cytochrome c-type biogenesis protein CcsB